MPTESCRARARASRILAFVVSVASTRASAATTTASEEAVTARLSTKRARALARLRWCSALEAVKRERDDEEGNATEGPILGPATLGGRRWRSGEPLLPPPPRGRRGRGEGEPARSRARSKARRLPRMPGGADLGGDLSEGRLDMLVGGRPKEDEEEGCCRAERGVMRAFDPDGKPRSESVPPDIEGPRAIDIEDSALRMAWLSSNAFLFLAISSVSRSMRARTDVELGRATSSPCRSDDGGGSVRLR